MNISIKLKLYMNVFIVFTATAFDDIIAFLAWFGDCSKNVTLNSIGTVYNKKKKNY
jgi:hypothetical protein